MAEWLQAVLLGALQGLTEFLPVSSSGHLVLAQEWLERQGGTETASFLAAEERVFFDLVLHVGTLLPILWFYRRDVGRILASPMAGPGPSEAGGFVSWLGANESRWLGCMVLAGSIPTAVIGIGLKDHFEALFTSTTPVCIALLVTAGLLMVTRYVDRGAGALKLTLVAALLIGLVQGAAITPGISRSGSTIAVALFLGMDRGLAARFSFLLSVPAILGGVVLELIGKGDTLFAADIDWFAVACGFVVSAGVGYLALILLVGIVKRGGLHRFVWYLVPAAVLAWVVLG